ncbi:MAG: aldehyde dehydrogenase family protein [Planctomycetota bacterium]|nr:aldehyde dehydrogenase family protein [Planctomycetota bacterium]
MSERLEVLKTYKLYIGGQFPRSESGRSKAVPGPRGPGGEPGATVHISLASRKDARDAVAAARGALEGWSRRTAYNRAQILYRLAEMIEGRREEFRAAIEAAGPAPGAAPGPAQEVSAAIDRLVAYAGWCDKFGQVLGSANPVAGPYYNFTFPEPTGVVAVVAPDERPLLALVGLMAPALCAGNTVVAVASEAAPLPACLLGEVCGVSDVPPGVINVLTGPRAELIPTLAGHREVDGVHAANLAADQATALRQGAAENVKRVAVRSLDDRQWFDSETAASPWWIERFVEWKTVWHPSGA